MECKHKIEHWCGYKDGIYHLYCAKCNKYLGQESFIPKPGLFWLSSEAGRNEEIGEGELCTPVLNI
jgi:hypothetical protein